VSNILLLILVAVIVHLNFVEPFLHKRRMEAEGKNTYSAGYSDGRAAGYEAGHSAGYRDGLKAEANYHMDNPVYARGYEDGYYEGKTDGKSGTAVQRIE